MKSAEKIKLKINALREDKLLAYVFRKGHTLYVNGRIVPLSQSDKYDECTVLDQYEDFKVRQHFDDELTGSCTCNSHEICPHRVAFLLHIHEYLAREEKVTEKPGIVYTREGMIKRVITERFNRAKQAKYQLQLSDNKYGEHQLMNESGGIYRITFHDFDKRTGYCSCPDYRTNKLGTCKHLIWAFKKYGHQKEMFQGKSQHFPFVEVYLNPLNDYRISWYFPGRVPEPELSAWLYRFFDQSLTLIPEKEHEFHLFLEKAPEFKQLLIRKEVYEKVEKINRHHFLQQIKKQKSLDYSIFNRKPYDFQRTGIEFLTFREKALLADEIGLGKTYQAIAAAWFKALHLGAKSCLIICPASLLSHWESEIKAICNQEVVNLGLRSNRNFIESPKEGVYFYLINYEKLSREFEDLMRINFSVLILDEVQRLRNFQTRTTALIREISAPHVIGLSGIPVTNRLTDLYAILSVIEPETVAPLWEFSYKYYYFDPEKENKITGYHHLDELAGSLSEVVLRRTRKDVMKDLPEISYRMIPVMLDADQSIFQDETVSSLQDTLQKSYLTPYNWQTIFRLITKLRMVADSAFLVQKDTAEMPKIELLRDLLINKINIKTEKRKVLIFSEWKAVILRIARFLREEEIEFVELHGDIPVSKRPALLEDFSNKAGCKVFLSSETGGVGLNLQSADIIINFDLPWTNQQLEQRIGRIERLGQKSGQLQIINLISVPSIESELYALHTSGDSGLNDLFSQRSDTGGELVLLAQIDKIRKLIQNLVDAGYRADTSLCSQDKSELWENYEVSIQPEQEPDESNLENLNDLLFDSKVQGDQRVEMLSELLDWMSKFHRQTTGNEWFSDKPVFEIKDKELIIRLKLKNE